MARLSRKEKQDKLELLSSLNQMNNSIESKHAAVNGECKTNDRIFVNNKYFFLLKNFSIHRKVLWIFGKQKIVNSRESAT